MASRGHLLEDNMLCWGMFGYFETHGLGVDAVGSREGQSGEKKHTKRESLPIVTGARLRNRDS